MSFKPWKIREASVVSVGVTPEYIGGIVGLGLVFTVFTAFCITLPLGCLFREPRTMNATNPEPLSHARPPTPPWGQSLGFMDWFRMFCSSSSTQHPRGGFGGFLTLHFSNSHGSSPKHGACRSNLNFPINLKAFQPAQRFEKYVMGKDVEIDWSGGWVRSVRRLLLLRFGVAQWPNGHACIPRFPTTKTQNPKPKALSPKL